MTRKVLSAEVYLWDSLIGYVTWNEETEFASFQYDQSFLKAPIEPSPLYMPRGGQVFTFQDLNKSTFKGLPGMLSDSLPDRFGSALIDVWLAQRGRELKDFNPVERLCYIGKRGMGALEYRPSNYRGRLKNVTIEVSEMVDLASKILSKREEFKEQIKQEHDQKTQEALTNLFVVGTSAGGARAKCLIALNDKTGEVRSGQVETDEDHSYWILKLDGVSNNRDKELSDPQGYGKIEYAYSLMAKDCHIEMSETRLLEENGRSHFATRRFDRLQGGKKIHMQSLCALAHFDFNMPGAYSYEQVFNTIREVVTHRKSQALEQQFKRAVFNIIGRNQDDHTKNIAFLMDKKGEWSLSPAFDITYSYNPRGEWTQRHQMLLKGKRDHFEIDDLLSLAKDADLKRSRAKEIIEEIHHIFQNWDHYAEKVKIKESHQREIKKYLRLDLVKT